MDWARAARASWSALIWARTSASPCATRLSELRWNTERMPRPPAHAEPQSVPIRERPLAADWIMAGEVSDVPAPGRPRPRSGSCGVNNDTRPIQNTARKIMTCPSVFPRGQHCLHPFAGRLVVSLNLKLTGRSSYQGQRKLAGNVSLRFKSAACLNQMYLKFSQNLNRR